MGPRGPTPVEILRRLCEELFGGDWASLRATLLERLEKTPRIEKLERQIQLDVKRIEEIAKLT